MHKRRTAKPKPIKGRGQIKSATPTRQRGSAQQGARPGRVSGRLCPCETLLRIVPILSRMRYCPFEFLLALLRRLTDKHGGRGQETNNANGLLEFARQHGLEQSL
jgi:hypothetical protein